MTEYQLTAKSASSLTAEQRAKLTKLAKVTGTDVHFLLRRAVSNFLNEEAPLWVKESEAADAAIKTLRRSLAPRRETKAIRGNCKPALKVKPKLEGDSILDQIRYLDEEFSA